MKIKSNFNKFLIIWIGECISSIGGGLTTFGLGVYMFEKTGSANSIALITLFGFLPTLLLVAPAGVLADRYDRHSLMMIGDGLSGLGMLYILICMIDGEASLTQICIGVGISSVFSSLMEPAYRSTVTDLLTKREYSKANGMISLAGSLRYLLSPLIAGILLEMFDIKLLLIIDISTFILTVITTNVVRKLHHTKVIKKQESFLYSFKMGFKAITEKKGIIVLIFVTSIITCFMGAVQILSEPMILSFKSSTVLGISEMVCASGMLVSSFYLGVRGIHKRYIKVCVLSLFLAGISMIVFGIKEDILIIMISGFSFFAMLPFANNCFDYLIRTNIKVDMQGRAWGLISFLSQIGYVVAYGFTGILADKIGESFNIGVGRGAAIIIISSGILLSITSLILLMIPSVKALETLDSNI